jgi:hypothetical protein
MSEAAFINRRVTLQNDHSVMRLFLTLALVCFIPSTAVTAQTRTGSHDDASTLVLAKNEQQPAAIDVDEKNVYWIAEYRSAIHKVSKAGGRITTIVDDQEGIRRMIVDKDFVYFLTNDEIRRVPTAGSKATTLVRFVDVGAKQSIYWYFTLDEKNVYFVSGPDNKQQIFKLGKSGGKPLALAPAGIPSGLAADDVNVYWLEYAEYAVKKVAIAGGEPVKLGDCERPGAGAIAVDAASVYCGDLNGNVLRFAKTGGVTTLVGDQNAPFDLLRVDDRNVYGLSVIKGIYRIGKSGGAPVRLVPLDRTDANFAIDEQNLYWSNYEEGTVSRRRK